MMNERIRQLAEQANIPAIDGVWDYNDRTLLVKEDGKWLVAPTSLVISTMIQSERGLEKFAELIVRECAELCREKGIFLANDRPNKDFDTIAFDCEAAIKQHFGVEE